MIQDCCCAEVEMFIICIILLHINLNCSVIENATLQIIEEMLKCC